MIEIDFPRANPLAKSSPFFLNDAVYGQQDMEQMLLLLTAMSDTDVPSGSLVLVASCQKKGSLSPQMTLLSETSRSEWEKEGCLVCENRMHPCKTCYDDIPDLQGVNIVRRCYFTNSHRAALWPITNYFSKITLNKLLSKVKIN